MVPMPELPFTLILTKSKGMPLVSTILPYTFPVFCPSVYCADNKKSKRKKYFIIFNNCM